MTIRTRGLGISVGLIAALVSFLFVAGAQAAPGDLDPTFSGDGKQLTDFPFGVDQAAGVVRQPDGKIVVVGSVLRSRSGAEHDFAIARYNRDGSLDPSFSGNGRQTTDFTELGGGDDRATGVALQADGKIVVVGRTGDSLDGRSCFFCRAFFALARYNPDGTLDASFSGDGKRATKFGSKAGATGVAIQGDGRILAVGSTCTHGDASGCDFALARYTANGSLDSTFSGDGKQTTDFGSAPDSAKDVALRAGTIIAVGVGGGNRDFAIARYSSNGSLDTTFAGDGKRTTDFGGSDAATGVATGEGGTIVVAGRRGRGGAFARYKANGSLDRSFSGDGRMTTNFLSPSKVALEVDGEIVGVGRADNDFALVRYHPDGRPDRSFSGDGRRTTSFGNVDGATGVTLQGKGRIVAVGSTCRNGCHFAIARYDPAGTLDRSFSGDGKQRTGFGGFMDRANAVAIQDDGKIVAVGGAGVSPDFAIARYNPDGTLDTSFSRDGRQTLNFGRWDVAGGVAIQPDGKIIVAGDTGNRLGRSSRFAVARYNPNGTLDTSFSDDGKQTTRFGDDDDATDLSLQADGKIVVVGMTGAGSLDGENCCSTTSWALARYNPDGSLDTSFSGDGKQTTDFGGAYQVASGVVLQGRKIVVAGLGGVNVDFAVARYKPNGTLDDTFSGDGMQTTDIAASDGASDVALQGRKIIAVGGWSHPNGGGFAMVRYNHNGPLDTSFADDGKQLTGIGSGASAGVVAPDGKIVVVGEGGDSLGAKFAIARYNAGGSIDTSFGDNGTEETDVGAPEFGGANDVALQDNGKIVAVGTGQGPTRTDDFALVRYLGG